jgi:hypothetical protein
MIGTRAPNFSAEAQWMSVYSGEERRTACYLIEGQVQGSVSKLDDNLNVGLVLKFRNVGPAKIALLVVQAARYTWSIKMSVCNSSCKMRSGSELARDDISHGEVTSRPQMPQNPDTAVPKRLVSIDDSLFGVKLRVAGRLVSSISRIQVFDV